MSSQHASAKSSVLPDGQIERKENSKFYLADALNYYDGACYRWQRSVCAAEGGAYRERLVWNGH